MSKRVGERTRMKRKHTTRLSLLVECDADNGGRE